MGAADSVIEKFWVQKKERRKSSYHFLFFLSAHLQAGRDSHQLSTEHGSMHLRTNQNENHKLQSSSSVNKGWCSKGRKKNFKKGGKEKLNMDCHEIYPEINGVRLPLKWATIIISIRNVALAIRYLPIETTNQMPATSGHQKESGTSPI